MDGDPDGVGLGLKIKGDIAALLLGGGGGDGTFIFVTKNSSPFQPAYIFSKKIMDSQERLIFSKARNSSPTELPLSATSLSILRRESFCIEII